MINYDLRAAGQDRWQQLMDEAAEVRRARGDRAQGAAVRPQLARVLVQMAAWLDPALKPARPARHSA